MGIVESADADERREAIPKTGLRAEDLEAGLKWWKMIVRPHCLV